MAVAVSAGSCVWCKAVAAVAVAVAVSAAAAAAAAPVAGGIAIGRFDADSEADAAGAAALLRCVLQVCEATLAYLYTITVYVVCFR